MPRSQNMVVVALAFTACADPTLSVAGVPDAVRYVALLTRDAGGAITAATPIAPWPKGQGLPVHAPAEGETILAGWSGAALAAAAGDPELVLLAGALQPASGCDPPLPEPGWVARWSGDRLEPLTASTLPALTAPWLRDRCPALDTDDVAIDVGCTEVRCEPGRVRVSPCRVDLDLSACGFGVVHTVLHPSGELCATFDDVGLACDAPARDGPGAVGAMCMEPDRVCRIHAHHPAADPPWTSERIAIVPAAPFLPEWLTYSEELRPKTPLLGYARDLVVLADRVVTATALDPLPCPTGRPDVRFDVFDLDGTRTATRAAPACVARLARDPTGDGFLAFYAEQGAWNLGRFTRDAELLAGVAVPDVAANGWYPTALETAPPGEIHALFGPSELAGAEDGARVLTTYDAVTLRELRRTPITHARCWTLALLDGGRVATACTDRREILFLTPATGAEEAVMLPRQNEGGRDSLLEVALHAPSGRLIASASRAHLAYVVDATTRAFHGGGFMFGLDAAPVRTTTWPMDQSQVFVAAITRAPDASWVALGALFDPAAGRFSSGTYELGPGIPSRASADANGTLWILLPWSAELVRLVPRSAS